MLQNLMNGIERAAERLAGWFQEASADYARNLLAAHGLIEVEVDHIRRGREEEQEGKDADRI